MWLLAYFTEEPTKAVLLHRILALEDGVEQYSGKPSTYCQVANYLFQIYATDDLTTEVEADITNHKKPDNMSANMHFKTLWKTELDVKEYMMNQG